MPTIYLHIGRGKTGTTLIQNSLSQRRCELLEHGVQFIYADDRGNGGGHQQFAKSFISDAPEFMIPAIRPEAVRREVFNEICESTTDAIVLSSENFAICDVSEVFEFFQRLPTDFIVKIIFFVRSQDEVAESQYNQIVKLKRLTSSFSEFVSKELDGCDYMKVATEWERFFGRSNMICRVYDAARNDVIDQFISCIREIRPNFISSFKLTDNETDANKSIGIKALTLARILNGVQLPEHERLLNRLFPQLTDNDLPALLFDSHQARKFRARFADSNRAFTDRYLGAPSEDLGGRRYSDQMRDQIRSEIESLELATI